MIKNILWDNDGVLVDTEKLYFQATQIVLHELGIVFHQHDYLKFMENGTSAFELTKNCGISEDHIAIKRQRRDSIYQELIKKEDICFPHVGTVIKELSNQYTMGIVTSSTREHFHAIHEKTDLLPYFDFVITSEECHYHKPHPEPYQKGLEKIRGTTENTIVIEDSIRGLLSALSTGLKCIIIQNALTRDLHFPEAWHVIPSIVELPNILQNSRKQIPNFKIGNRTQMDAD
ncbi:MAG: HAD family phosphatase [wastewater metagenome]|nr:HAD family phosphatase [Candidatus Loosdrechtia aerotolerans]